MIVPNFVKIIDFMCVITLEIEMMVGFMKQFSLDSIFKLKLRKPHKICILLWNLKLVFFQLIDIFHNEISRFTFLCFIVLIITKRRNLDLTIIFNKSGLFSTGCSCLLISSLHILHFLNRVQIILYL